MAAVGFCILFSGDQLDSANIGSDKNGGRAVNFVLKNVGKDLFAAWTTKHINEQFAIVLDNAVISAPNIQSAIAGGTVQITNEGTIGGMPQAEATNLVNVLKFGALPFPVEELSSDTIDPTLVRGLDYYTRTIFSLVCDRLGAQSEIGGGGRYDGLVEQLGGPPTPAIGWAADRAVAGGVGERGKLTDRVPVTVEPGACLPAKGGARSADVLVVTAGDRTRS